MQKQFRWEIYFGNEILDRVKAPYRAAVEAEVCKDYGPQDGTPCISLETLNEYRATMGASPITIKRSRTCF